MSSVSFPHQHLRCCLGDSFPKPNQVPNIAPLIMKSFASRLDAMDADSLARTVVFEMPYSRELEKSQSKLKQLMQGEILSKVVDLEILWYPMKAINFCFKQLLSQPPLHP